MGNFEKLVVLTVLFLVASIAGVSLHDDGAGESNDPLVDTNVRTEEPATVAGGDQTPMKEAGGAPLSSLVVPPAEKTTDLETSLVPEEPKMETEPVTPKAEAARGSLLVTMAGLTKPVFGEDYMLYAWRKGDTHASVASRFYGDRNKRYLIRNNNEGAAFLAGDEINIPIFDTAAGAGKRDSYQPAPEHRAPVQVPVETAAVNYTVVDGDSLWSIAKDAYGKGTKWEQIFKANRDLLADSSSLKPGMELRIP